VRGLFGGIVLGFKWFEHERVCELSFGPVSDGFFLFKLRGMRLGKSSWRNRLIDKRLRELRRRQVCGRKRPFELLRLRDGAVPDLDRLDIVHSLRFGDLFGDDRFRLERVYELSIWSVSNINRLVVLHFVFSR